MTNILFGIFIVIINIFLNISASLQIEFKQDRLTPFYFAYCNSLNHFFKL